jgi:hypothetical protein
MRDPRLLGPGGEQQPNQSAARFFVMGNTPVTEHQINFVKASYRQFRNDVIASVIDQHKKKILTPDGGTVMFVSRFGQDYVFYEPATQGVGGREDFYPTANFFAVPIDSTYTQDFEAPEENQTQVYEADWTTAGAPRVSTISAADRVIFAEAQATALSAHPGNATWFSADGNTVSWWATTSSRYAVEAPSRLLQPVSMLYPNVSIERASENGYNDLGWIAFEALAVRYPPGPFQEVMYPSALISSVEPRKCVWIDGSLVVLDVFVDSACLATRAGMFVDRKVLRVAAGQDVIDYDLEAVLIAMTLPGCEFIADEDPGSDAQNKFYVQPAGDTWGYGAHPPYWNLDGNKAVWVSFGVSNSGVHEITVDAAGETYALEQTDDGTVTLTQEPHTSVQNQITLEGDDYATLLAALQNRQGNGVGGSGTKRTTGTTGLARNCFRRKYLAADYRGNERVVLSWESNFNLVGLNTGVLLQGLTLNDGSYNTMHSTVDDTITDNYSVTHTVDNSLLLNGVPIKTGSWVLTNTWVRSRHYVDVQNDDYTAIDAYNSTNSTYRTSALDSLSQYKSEAAGSKFVPRVMGGDMRGAALYVHLQRQTKGPDTRGNAYLSLDVGRKMQATGVAASREFNRSGATVTVVGVSEDQTIDSDSTATAALVGCEDSFVNVPGPDVGSILEIDCGTGAVTAAGRRMEAYSEYYPRTTAIVTPNQLPYPLTASTAYSGTYHSDTVAQTIDVTESLVHVSNLYSGANESFTRNESGGWGAVQGIPTKGQWTYSVGADLKVWDQFAGDGFSDIGQGMPAAHNNKENTAYDYDASAYVLTTTNPQWDPLYFTQGTYLIPNTPRGGGYAETFDFQFPHPPTTGPQDLNTLHIDGASEPPIGSTFTALSPDTNIQYTSIFFHQAQTSPYSLDWNPFLLSKWFVDGAEVELDIGYKPNPADPQFVQYTNPVFTGPTP